MTASSRGFDEELRSLARSARLKSLKKIGDTTSNGQTRENTLKLLGKYCKIHAKSAKMLPRTTPKTMSGKSSDMPAAGLHVFKINGSNATKHIWIKIPLWLSENLCCKKRH